jgi:hypothetical protein
LWAIAAFNFSKKFIKVFRLETPAREWAGRKAGQGVTPSTDNFGIIEKAESTPLTKARNYQPLLTRETVSEPKQKNTNIVMYRVWFSRGEERESILSDS